MKNNTNFHTVVMRGKKQATPKVIERWSSPSFAVSFRLLLDEKSRCNRKSAGAVARQSPGEWRTGGAI